MDYDFSKLTPLQEWLLVYQGWRVGQKWPDGSVWTQPGKRTVRKLIDRGLLTEVESRDLGMTVTEYVVSLPVHAAFCARAR